MNSKAFVFINFLVYRKDFYETFDAMTSGNFTVNSYQSTASKKKHNFFS